MNIAEVTVVLATLSEVYPGRVGSGDVKKTASVWSVILADADPRQVLAAAIAWTRSRKPHPPTPGELLDISAAASSLTPEEAWGLVRQEIQRVGHSGDPVLPDLAMRSILAVGGDWAGMCRTLLSRDVPSLRARFLEAYRGMETRDTKRIAVSQAESLLDGPRAMLALAGPLAKRYRLQGAESSES